MENETSGSESRLDDVRLEASDRDLRAALDIVSRLAAVAFGVHLWFARVRGPRWSYLAGCKNERPSADGLCRIWVEKDIGVVTTDWEGLPETVREALLDFLKRLIALRTGIDEEEASLA